MPAGDDLAVEVAEEIRVSVGGEIPEDGEPRVGVEEALALISFLVHGQL